MYACTLKGGSASSSKIHPRYTNRLKPPFEGAIMLTLGLSEDAQAVARPTWRDKSASDGSPPATRRNARN